MTHWHGVILVALAALAGCKVGPNYERPEISVPKIHRACESQSPGAHPATTQPDPAAEEKTLGELAWWEVFEDPTLQDLIRTAIRQNYDLQIAAARVEEARALLRITRADQYPSISTDVASTSERVSQNATALPLIDGQQGIGVNSLGMTLAWELDFWGKFRRASEASKAQLLATEESRLSVLQSLVTDLAVAYFDLRELDLELEIARETMTSRERSLRLIRLRQERGVSSMIDVRQAEVLVSTAARSVPDLERRIEQTENEISVLLGENPNSIPRGQSLREQALIPDVPAGLPSSLLERRPDIRLAEQQLIEANARIGVAKAAFYPSISLTASAGLQSAALSDLFSGPSGAWSFVGSLAQPIFEGGRLRGRLQATRAVQEQALANYQATIQNAFREVADALIAYRKTRELRAEQERLTETLREATRLSRMRYEGGVTSYLEVLDNERQLFDAELQLAQVQRDELLTVVLLYKTLGGGWGS
jgi:multidrug efflux system outer membrane protein